MGDGVVVSPRILSNNRLALGGCTHNQTIMTSESALNFYLEGIHAYLKSKPKGIFTRQRFAKMTKMPGAPRITWEQLLNDMPASTSKYVVSSTTWGIAITAPPKPQRPAARSASTVFALTSVTPSGPLVERPSFADLTRFGNDGDGGDVTSGAESVSDHNGESSGSLLMAQPSAVLSSYFRHGGLGELAATEQRGVVLASAQYARDHFRDFALLGHLTVTASDAISTSNHACQSNGVHAAYLNTDEPFCMVTVGVQGGGKSHTMGCILESCLLPYPSVEDSGTEVVRLRQPMTALVLHFDQSDTTLCEATGLIRPNEQLQRLVNRCGLSKHLLPCLARNKVVVLVSPTYYQQRRAFYGDACEVRPLLFSWAKLSADHIKRLMLVEEQATQLYMALLLDKLRQYQAANRIPPFANFIEEMEKSRDLSAMQAGPLKQRLQLLQSFVGDSVGNAKRFPQGEGSDMVSACGEGKLVIVDLTDPLLSKGEANSIFQVLVEQYRTVRSRFGKLLVLDEAHKFMDGDSADGLSAAIVNTARLMRHDGIRLAVSTQSPLALAPELLELVTLAILHNFRSADWFAYLSKKLPLSTGALATIMRLNPGDALVCTSRHQLSATGDGAANDGCKNGDEEEEEEQQLEQQDCLGYNTWPISIRQRFTADHGATRRNDGQK